ncbi:proteasome assembly chaperone 4-like isoform X2 [Thamnophis elegans]|uniref:proteasome assembly chaperone 4-like isoform X2 n=1 Tax=Thamnophis elegans TaxID=35005 RepID=UPI001378929C|nr:proteasome assembly chaperone 4-like isoform X2 [Thamnophis elegans]
MEEAQEPGRGDDDAPAPPAAEEAGISLHNFCGRLAEQVVHFHAMRLRDSLFLWVGDGPELSNLAVAMCNPRDSIPASTLLFGNASDNTSNSLAQRLASKTKKQIFVSYSIQNTDNSFILLVENRIKEEMATFPDKF